MKFITDLFNNRIFVSAALGWFVAQVLKTLIHMLITKQFVLERMVGSGGMPSSHSATVCGLATAVGMCYGGGSYEFAMAAILAIVVMHDAMGVRMETGQPKLSMEKRLKEFVGHTPLQVLMGAVLGIIIAVIVMNI